MSSDISFLLQRGYRFGSKLEIDSLSKVKFGESYLGCSITKKRSQDDNATLENLKKLSHPHIIRIHSILQKSDRIFVFTQWSEEGSLFQHINKKGMVKETKANLWFYQIVCAVKYLHDLGLAHCNLSCESLLVFKEQLKISGLTRIQDCSNNDKVRLTPEKSYPNYCLPPEVNNKEEADPKKCDIYALGVILFMMINEKIPFNETSQLVADQMKRRYWMRAFNVSIISIACQVVINTLLEPDPKLRWSIDKIFKMKWLEKFIDNQGDS